MPQRRLVWLELAAVLGLAASWLGFGLLQHSRPGGLTIEQVLLGGLFLPSHVRRLAACWWGTPAEGAALRWLELGALASIWSGAVSLPLALASLLPMAQLLRVPPVQAHLDPVLPFPWRGASRVAALGGVASAGLAAWASHPMSTIKLALALPLLLEALLGRDGSLSGALRRLSGGVLVGVLAWVRLDQLLALAAGCLVATSGAVALCGRASDPAVRRAHWRQALLRVMACSCALVTAVTCLEVFAWLRPDEATRVPPEGGHGVQYVPGSTFTYEGSGLRERADRPNVVVWNALGMHDVDHHPSRSTGLARVMVLGDSFVEGRQVPLEALYHRALERELTAVGAVVEVMSLGRSGWGQANELRAFQETGAAFDPDLVLVEFLAWNDVTDNLPALEALVAEEEHSASPVRPLLADALRKHLWGTGLILERLDALLATPTEAVQLDVYRPAPRKHADLWRAGWERTQELLVRLDRAVKAQGARLAVVIFTSPFEVESGTGTPPSWLPQDVDLRWPARQVLAGCDRAGIPCLDLLPGFMRLPAETRTRLHLPHDSHWAPAGHAQAARLTAEFLVRDSGLWAGVERRAGVSRRDSR